FAAVGNEAIGVAPGGEESFLDRVFCQLFVAEDPQREPVRGATKPVVKLGERGLVRPGQHRYNCLVREVRERSRHKPRSLAHRHSFAPDDLSVRSEPVRRIARTSVDTMATLRPDRPSERSNSTMRKRALVLLGVAAVAALGAALASRGGSPSAAKASRHRE